MIFLLSEAAGWDVPALDDSIVTEMPLCAVSEKCDRFWPHGCDVP